MTLRNNRVRINGSGGTTVNLGMLPETELSRLEDAIAEERRARTEHEAHGDDGVGSGPANATIAMRP